MTRRILFAIFVLAVTLGISAAGSASAYTPKSLPPPSKNVYETIEANKRLDKFFKMIDEAGLKELFSPASGEPVTVFAPDDEAIAHIPSVVMQRIESSKSNLQSFVKYHMIAGSMVSSGAIKGRRASPASANGESLPFDGSDRANAPKIGDGELVQADIAATNGLVHIVSGALVPPSLEALPPPPPLSAAKAAPAATAAPAASPAAMTTSEAAAATTSAAASATTSAAAAAPVSVPMKITTTGVAKAPEINPPKASLAPGSGAAHVTATGVAKAPAATTTTSALPETTSSSGFELFGHKFSW